MQEVYTYEAGQVGEAPGSNTQLNYYDNQTFVLFAALLTLAVTF